MDPKPLIARFEPFSFDLELGHLLMNGHRIHLPEQNARLLSYLIQRSGRLASREELHLVLWPHDRPSDWDQAITKAISHLRTALRDTPSTPRYIETIPQRGYRFCAPVDFIPSPLDAEALHSADQAAPLDRPTLESPYADPHIPSLAAVAIPPPRRSFFNMPRWVAVMLLATIAAAAGAGGYRLHALRQAANPPPTTVGIVPFVTKTPDGQALAMSFRLALIDGLAESPQLRMIASNSTLNLKPGPALTADASKLGLDVVIFGYFINEGDHFILCLELIRTRDSTHLATLRYSGSTDEIVATRFWVQKDVLSHLKAAQANIHTSGIAFRPSLSATPSLAPLAAASTIPR